VKNADIVRRGYEAAMRRPTPDWEVMAECFHPDHTYRSVLDVVEGGDPNIGAAGYRGWRARMDAELDWAVEIEDLREASGERVVALCRTSVTGRRGGVKVESRIGVVLTLRDGRISSTVAYRSPEDALAAAGLED
jgi:ketosteroid isomerase-like protein